MICICARNAPHDAHSPTSQLRLKVVLLPLLPLSLALADNALAEPFRGETVIQFLQILYNVLTAADDGVLGRNRAIGLDPKLEGCEEWVGDLVCGEDNVVILEKALGEEVAECVVFLVERKDGGVGDAYCADF